VVNELHTNDQPGQFDTFVELRNVSSDSVDISGWQLFGCNGTGDTGLRATIDAGTELAAGEHYLLTAEEYAASYDADFTVGRAAGRCHRRWRSASPGRR
jgi:hypothetical protein